MKNLLAVLFMIFLIPACLGKNPGTVTGANSIERHLKNVTQLTFDGDNGEAYFSWDGKKLIWQSSRGGYACDKIWTMNIDGSDKRMVSPDHGAQYVFFLLPGGPEDHLRFDEPHSRRLSAQAEDARRRALRLAALPLQYFHGKC